MYYIAICDDDQNFASYIERLFTGRLGLDSDNARFYHFASGEELIKSFERNIPFHLLILDMQMKKMDGDVTAKEFRKKYPHAVLVFCSGVCHPTVKSFEAGAYRYLLKEYDSGRMAQELKAVLDEVKRRAAEPGIAITYRNEVIFAAPGDILYVSVRKHGSSVFLYDRDKKTAVERPCSKSASELYDELGGFRFAYIHNSYFVNLGYIVTFAGHEVRLTDGTTLSVARSKEKNFKEKLSAYLADKY